MKIRLDPKKPVDKSEWHTWFAWHPVRMGPYLVWLQRLERKGKFTEDSCGGCWTYEYQELVYYP